MDRAGQEPAKLRHYVERALVAALERNRILPALHQLVRVAADGSDDAVFAHAQLAELLVDRSPWRASLHARRGMASRPDAHGAWAALGFCQANLGHFRFAVAAYERAAACAPNNASYAHNVGHLRDVALGAPGSALPWLERAHCARPESAEVTASLAHALARTGQRERATELLTARTGGSFLPRYAALLRWISDETPRRGGVWDDSGPDAPVSHRSARRLRGALEIGLRSLPFNSTQRARAKDLARALSAWGPADHPRCIAAAIAFAVVTESGLPLTLAEVAASFRVGARTVRSHLPAVRAGSDAAPLSV